MRIGIQPLLRSKFPLYDVRPCKPLAGTPEPENFKPEPYKQTPPNLTL